MHYRRKPGQTSYCWLSAKICAAKRAELRAKRLGKVGVCQLQPVAYCFSLVEAPALSRQSMCRRTMVHCNQLRAYFSTHKSEFDLTSPCQPMRNTDPFDSYADFEARRHQE